MIKVLTTAQTKELDNFTINQAEIQSIELMERACQAFVDWFVDRFDSSNSVFVICGTGNNGGDGLGIARLLDELNYEVKIFIIQGKGIPSSDFKKNMRSLPPGLVATFLSKSDSVNFPTPHIIIDALFGSGLSRPLEGFYETVVNTINDIDAIRVAVDIPSGLFADGHTSSVSVKAHYTVSFQLPKLAFLLPECYEFVGEWYCVDIGLSKDFISDAASQNFVLDRFSIRSLIRHRKKFNHKGDFGHSLIVAGSLGKIGANILATRAALRTGSGLVTSLTPQCGYTAIQSSVPEAMVLVDSQENFLSQSPDISPFSAIGIGPGLGKDKETVGLLSNLLTNNNLPCVLDADAINILAENSELQSLIPANTILTPHPGEFRRLVGEWQNDFERLELQRNLSKRLNSIVVLKGAHTSISMPNGDVYFNSTGNPAMATAGSGDVLTGIITALLAQYYSPPEAALLGVYLHGMAGDSASKGRYSIIASDIIAQIPKALSRLTFKHITE